MMNGGARISCDARITPRGKTSDESPFCNFHIRCLRCDSYKLPLAVQYDESEDAEILIILCQQCRQAEKVV